MRSALFAGFILGGLAAFAQDRTQTVPEAGAVWLKSEITPNPVDGGCFFLAYGANDAGMSIVPSTYDFGGAQCDTMRTKSVRAVKKDLQVGNGAAP